jgi:hypothetical protein
MYKLAKLADRPELAPYHTITPNTLPEGSVELITL